MQNKKNKYFPPALFYFLIKTAFSAVLIYVFTKTVNTQEVMVNLTRCHPLTYGMCLLSLWLCYFFSAYRWRHIVQKQSVFTLSLWESFKVCWFSFFLNQGLPGSIGGDVYRAVVLGRKGARKSWCFQTLLFDRLFGVLSMGVLGICALLVQIGQGEVRLLTLPASLAVVMPLVAGGILLGFLFLSFMDAFLYRALTQTKIADPKADASLWGRVICALSSLARDLPANLRCFYTKKDILFWGAGGLATLFLYLPIYCFACDLGYPVSFWQIACVMPTVFVTAALPISFAGWGIREACFVTLFACFGVPGAEALTLSILYGLVSLISTFPGVLVYFWPTKEKKQPVLA